jgi:Cu/Zn superoxide dismutase
VMIRKGTVVIAAVAVLLGAGCGSGSQSASSTDEITVTLAEQNDSAESGTAILTAEGNQTKVVLDLQSKSATAAAQPQPAHIHKGSCAKLDPTPAYGLMDVKAGTSTSTVDAKLDALRSGSFAINVHKSANEIKNYVACGDVGTGRSSDYDPLGHDKESDY